MTPSASPPLELQAPRPNSISNQGDMERLHAVHRTTPQPRSRTPFRDLRAISLGQGHRKTLTRALTPFPTDILESERQSAPRPIKDEPLCPTYGLSSVRLRGSISSVAELGSPSPARICSPELPPNPPSRTGPSDHHDGGVAAIAVTVVQAVPMVRRRRTHRSILSFLVCSLTIAVTVCLRVWPNNAISVPIVNTYISQLNFSLPRGTGKLLILMAAAPRTDELAAHDTTRSDRYDWALLTSGSRVNQAFTSTTYHGSGSHALSSLRKLLGFKVASPLSPEVALERGDNQCWPMDGSSGYLGIDLAHPIHLHAVAISHAPASVAVDLRAAPRSLAVWGVQDDRTIPSGLEHLETPRYSVGRSLQRLMTSQPHAALFLLGRFTYDIRAHQTMQTFDISRSLHPYRFQSFIVAVEDNWGFEDSTCLCRVRFHGKV